MTSEPEGLVEASAARYAVALPGPGLGEVAVGDVVEFLHGVVNLVAHGAATEIARPIGIPGRRGAAIEGASSKLRLVALASGSLIAEFAPAPAPADPSSLDLDVDSLSEAGLAAVFDVLGGRSTRPELAAALVEFARRFEARRPGQPIVFHDRRSGADYAIALDSEVIGRLQDERAAGQTRVSDSHSLSGRIYEANVDTDEARLRTPTGETIKVDYEPKHEDEIKRLLGDRASIRGDVTLDPATRRIRSIHVTEVFAGDQLAFEGVDFWSDPSLLELAKGVEATPVDDPDDLHIDASEAEWDELDRVLHERRP